MAWSREDDEGPRAPRSSVSDVGFFVQEHGRLIEPLGLEIEGRLAGASSEDERFGYAVAAIGLSQATDRAVEHAMRWYREASPEARRERASNLAQVMRGGGPKVAHAIRPLLRSGTTEERLWALGVLEWMPDGDAWAAWPELAELLGDPDQRVRALASTAVGFVGPTATESVPALKKMIQDPAREVRVAVVEALANIRGADPALKAWFLEQRDAQGPERFAAVWGLAFLKPPAVDELVEIIQSDASDALRAVAVRALGRLVFEIPLPEGPALACLRGARKDADPTVRKAAEAVVVPDA